MARPRTTTPTKPDDARAQRSIQALRTALLALLEQRPFDQIAIKDITEAAGLSYQTFFRRFASREELLDYIARQEVQHFLSLGAAALKRGGLAKPAQGSSTGQPAGSTAEMCAYVAERRKLWDTLLNGGAAAAMRAEFMRVARQISDANRRRNSWIPLELAVPFVASGVFEIFAWWMRQPDDYPVANVITLFDALIVDVTARPRNISLIPVNPERDAIVRRSG